MFVIRIKCFKLIESTDTKLIHQSMLYILIKQKGMVQLWDINMQATNFRNTILLNVRTDRNSLLKHLSFLVRQTFFSIRVFFGKI